MYRRHYLAILGILVVRWFHSCTAVVHLRGTGASFPAPVYENWIQSYKIQRQSHVTLSVSYRSTGSGTGKQLIVSRDPSIEYAGSDSLLSEEDRNSRTDLVLFPTMAGGTVLGYNMPECSDDQRLNLTRDHVVGIYNGSIQFWNDSSIRALNHQCALPDAEIIVIARADKSGTTSMFTEALSRFSSEWNSTYGTFSEGRNDDTDLPYEWNADAISFFGQNNRGVSGLILSIKHTIGYLSVSAATEADIHYAQLQNKYGSFTAPTETAIQQAMDTWSEGAGKKLTGTLSDQAHPEAYPIAGFTYLVVYKTEMENCDSAKELVRYVDWFMTEESAQEDCRSFFMVPLSKSLIEKNRQEILKEMTCKGQNIWDMVQRDIAEENRKDEPWIVPVAVSLPLFLLLVSVLLGYILYQRWKLNKMIDNDEWEIPIEDIIFYFDDKTLSGARSKLGTMKSIKSLQNIEDIPEGSELLDQILQWPGKWKGHIIGVRLLEIKDIKEMNRELKKLLLWMRDSVIQINVVRFFGLTSVENDKYVISEYCGKGQMTDIIQDEKFNLTNDFKFSLATDIAVGMNFLHNQGLVHGCLSSSCCLIDSRWTVKISDWEYCELFRNIHKKRNPLQYLRKEPHHMSKYAAAFRDFWVAPEIIRSDFENYPSQATDVYSYSIILQEIFTREDPYAEHADSLTPDEVLRAVVNNQLRPQTCEDTPLNVRQIMEIGWSDTANSRPNFEQIVKMLRQSRSSRKSVLDSMMEAMEEYTAHLEERVEERTSELSVAKQNMETMMKDIIPNHLVSKVANGQCVETSISPSLGVIQAEVMNINDVTEHSLAKDVVQYLNDIHSEIEGALSLRDTYRSNLQGDAFTIIVGLQSDLKDIEKVAEAVAHVSLDVILYANKVTCPSSISKPFEFRLGAHIGSVVSGIVGQRAPKYVVMGETMNLAETLVRNSLPSKVRISKIMFENISKKTYFYLETAPDIDHKGNKIESHWLKGRDSLVVDIPSDLSVDSGVDSDKPRSESRASKVSEKSQDSVKSVPTNNCWTGKNETLEKYNSSWGLEPVVTIKPPKGKQSNKIHPKERV